MKEFKQTTGLFFLGGIGYAGLEILWRGYTHWTMALTGGVARMGELFTGRFRRALEHLVPQCVYQPAKYSPVVGAALCVLSESAGVDITAPGVAENLMKEKMGEAHVDG